MNFHRYFFALLCILLLPVFLYTPAVLAATHGNAGKKSGENKQIPLIHRFDIYNSSKGKIKSIFRERLAHEPITISIKDLNILGVDSLRMALRERNVNGKIGRLVKFSKTGGITFEAPPTKTYYDLFLMNAVNNVDYDCLDKEKIKLPNNKRMVRVIRRDFGQAGSNKLLQKVFKRLNSALNPFGIQYGYMDYGKKYRTGDMSAGYGYMGDKGKSNQPWFGTHWSSGFAVNVNKLKPETRFALFAVGLEEAFEVYFGVDDICGFDSGGSIQLNGLLTPKGKDIIAYFAVINNAQ